VPLLECVGRAYAVSPDAGLRSKAVAAGWKVLGWAGEEPAEAPPRFGVKRQDTDSPSAARSRALLPPTPSPAFPTASDTTASPAFAFAAGPSAPTPLKEKVFTFDPEYKP